MKLKTALMIGAVAAAAAALAFAFASPARGQARDRDWYQHLTILEGPGSRIGVTARELEPAEMERLKVTGGVFIETVTPEGPAAKDGLRADDVVVEFDGERVRSLRQFTRLVRETPPSRSIKTAVFRDGKRQELTVTPVAGGQVDLSIDSDRVRRQIEEFTTRIRPFEYGFEVPDLGARARLGVTVQGLTSELAAYFGASDGVLVSSVVADSPASRSGIRAGDVITSVDGRNITSAADLAREVRTSSSDGELTLGIVRDKKQTTVSAKVETPPDRRAPTPRQVRPIRIPIQSAVGSRQSAVGSRQSALGSRQSALEGPKPSGTACNVPYTGHAGSIG
jgi:C-terminal processing protease CtpA/Prc